MLPALVPAFGSFQELRCTRCSTPRYFHLKWEHITVPMQEVELVVKSSLPEDVVFYGYYTATPITSQEQARIYPFDLFWNESDGVHEDCSVDLFVDFKSVRTHGLETCPVSFNIALGGQQPYVNRFRASGWIMFTHLGERFIDRETVFSRIHRELKGLVGTTFGEPLVKVILIHIGSKVD